MPPLVHKTRHFLVFATLCFACALFLYGFLFWEVKAKNERISEKRNEIEVQTKQEGALSSKRTLIQNTAALREELRSYIVGREETVLFIESLEALAGTSGTVSSIKAVEAGNIDSGKANLEELRIVLESVGTWENVLRFLGFLELLPFQGTVERVSLSHQVGAGGTGGQWRGQFIIRMLKEKYYR